MRGWAPQGIRPIDPAERARYACAIIAVTILTGTLGAPFADDEVPFDMVRREHFDALTVEHGGGSDPSPATLLVHVQLLGDGADIGRDWLRDRDDPIRASTAPVHRVLPEWLSPEPAPEAVNPFIWLATNANVHVVENKNGVPLYLTLGDLSATSGRATLGATLRNGMAAEVGNPKVGPCVVAHEMLHFLGLRHVDERDNIMHSNCTSNKLADSHMRDDQRTHVDSIREIRALTPRGIERWAVR